ncbi:uncharacterized protein LOC119398573 [Rhipicephalus sanguineus]|uniref:uncharacterized protein LOC119398573 n=1 Tax=Rhipicephalus sanguineus TaxID=34632 RepID=UPI0018962887|nr:uncharacterized protein LOC119398573 [Rhipicephalus sanguineus]
MERSTYSSHRDMLRRCEAFRGCSAKGHVCGKRAGACPSKGQEWAVCGSIRAAAAEASLATEASQYHSRVGPHFSSAKAGLRQGTLLAFTARVARAGSTLVDSDPTRL